MLKIAHFADIHIRNIERHEEYQKIFNKIYNELTKIQPDRIVISGDLFESFIEISNEAKIISGDLLNNLSKIAKVIITRGNHDIRKKNINRIDSVETIIKLINNPNINYYNKTDFYEDDKIIWVVYDHVDKHNDPWLNQIKDKNKIYIGLFHDPIYGSLTDVGKVFNDKQYKDISYFKNNDYMMLGDIHKRQYFRKNKSAAYPGSTIQQHFGETIENHGFLVWYIENNNDFEVKEYNIESDHTFLNLYINELTDYDNLNLQSTFFGSDLEIKVHWKDYSSNITTYNEKKIRDYIKDKFNTLKVKFEKTFIYNDVISSKMLSESLDLTDITVQNNIFKEYLEEQKYKSDDINEILRIDDIINSRLQLNNNKNNIEWNIEKFWFSNFKSYGDNNEIDWSDIDGIIQISGINQEGKTTILDAITYILFGKTTTTIKREEFGDARYINNKRKLDYCIGGAVINANGEKYVIQRKTERIWNKNKTFITSCPTTIDYYKSDIICEANKLTGEQKNKTQKELDLILGDLKDFIRLSFTNADNLDDALSENRSVFIDNIIRDAGMDIFEYKLEEFKEYKKELSEEKLIVDIQESETNIKNIKSEINIKLNEIKSNQNIIDEFNIELKEQNINRDELNKKLNIIDSTMVNFNENINLNSIENYKLKINDSKTNIVILEREIQALPSSFDSNNINKLKIKLKETNDKLIERKDEISKIKNLILSDSSKQDKVLSKIKELKDSEIKKLQLKISDNELNIEKIKNLKENIIHEEINKIKSNLNSIVLEKNDIVNKMKLFQKDGINIKSLNDLNDIEIEKHKDFSCPNCGKKYDPNDPNDDEHLTHLKEKISELLLKKEEYESKIQKYINEFKKLKSLLPEIENKELELTKLKIDLEKGIYSDVIKEKLKSIGSTKLLKQENEDIKIKIEEIKNNIFENVATLNENISKGNQLLKNIEKSKNEYLDVLKNIESEIKNFNIENIENDIEIEEKKKTNFELRNKKISQKENLILSNENYNLKIKELQLEIDKYQEYKTKIEENKSTQFSIDRIDEKILIIKNSIKDLTDENIEIEKDIIIKENNIENISTKIKKYLKQKKREELLKEYQKCIGRDGIPSWLLKKSIHLINKELNDLLTNVNFTLFFDEDLILKMSMDDRLDVTQLAITSSGMERTFCSLALKIALRSINTKSRSNFIFMDELTGKMIGNSIQLFMNFLDDLKNKVNKIIIIEHNHTIDYQALIEVHKDEDFISHLKMIV